MSSNGQTVYSVVEIICRKPRVVNFAKLKDAKVHFAELIEEHLDGSDDVFIEDSIQEAIRDEEYTGTINDDYAVYLQYTELKGNIK